MSRRRATLPPALAEAGVTPREAEVLEALGGRLSNAEIAERLVVSVRTAESHVSSLLKKLDAADRTELATIARTIVIGPSTTSGLPLVLYELVSRGPFVGRHDEVARLRTLWDEAAGGRSRVVVVTGEAGIGKSRLVAEVAGAADRRGATVALGRCDDGAPTPFQPVIEILTTLLPLVPQAEVRRAAGAGAHELARLLPGLAPGLEDGPPRSGALVSTDPAAARHRLFEAVTGIITVAARQRSVFVAVEDLHWADVPTLQLLRHLGRRADRTRLLVVATARGTRLPEPLLDLVADLRRGPGCEAITLRGLAPTEIAALVALRAGLAARLDETQRDELVQRLAQQTGGNPFFIGELLRTLDDMDHADVARGAVAVPATIRDLILHSAARLSEVTRHVLSVAAVVGREFRIDVVGAVTELSEDRIIAALEEARAAELVDDVRGRPGWMLFTHALVHETLEAELASARRSRLHRLVGEYLEAESGDSHLAELARHFHLAATPRDNDKAVTYAVAAAEQASALLAHEHAAELYGRGLSALDLAPGSWPARRFELLLARSIAARRGGMQALARDSGLAAAQVAAGMGDARRQADAALAAGDAAGIWTDDSELVDTLASSLAALDGHDPGRRARVLARLAQAQYYSVPHERRVELSREAVRVARATGDHATLAAVLHARHVALWGPGDTSERLTVAEELVAVAEHLDDDELLLQGHGLRLVDLLESGDVDGADEAIAQHARIARRLGQPLHIRDSALWAAMRALLDGRFDDTEREIERALALSLRARDPHAHMFEWVQRYWLAAARDPDETEVRTLLDAITRLADDYPQVPAWRTKIALLHIRLGDRDAAQAVAAELAAERFARLPRDAIWVSGLYTLAEVVSTLGDARQARVLYDLLLPFADRIVVVDRALVCLGSVARALGLLASVLGEVTAARQHHAAALLRHEHLTATPLADHSRGELAAALQDDRVAAPPA